MKMNVLDVVFVKKDVLSYHHCRLISKHSASCVFFSPLFLPTFVASL